MNLTTECCTKSQLTLEADTAVSSSTEIWTAVISASCPYKV